MEKVIDAGWCWNINTNRFDRILLFEDGHVILQDSVYQGSAPLRSDMRVKLVFRDWTNKGKSVYNTEEGFNLSSGDFHSGTTFTGTISLNEEQEQELREAIKDGYDPVFLLTPVDNLDVPSIAVQAMAMQLILGRKINEVEVFHKLEELDGDSNDP